MSGLCFFFVLFFFSRASVASNAPDPRWRRLTGDGDLSPPPPPGDRWGERKKQFAVVEGGLGKIVYPPPPSTHRLPSGNIRFYDGSLKTRSGLTRISSRSADVTVDTALSLDGTGRLDYALREGPKRDALLRRALEEGGGATSDPDGPSRLEVKFRTRGKSGTLLHVQESSNYTTVKVPESDSRSFPGKKKKKKDDANQTQNIAKPMFTHSLIPVNTSSESAPRGNPTPWKSWERLKPFFFLARELTGTPRLTPDRSGRPDPVWEASLFTYRQPFGSLSRLLRLFLIRFLIPGRFPNGPQSSFILSVIPFFFFFHPHLSPRLV